MTGKLTMIFTETDGGMETEAEVSLSGVSVISKLQAASSFMQAFEFDEPDRALLALMLMSGANLTGESTSIDIGAIKRMREG